MPADDGPASTVSGSAASGAGAAASADADAACSAGGAAGLTGTGAVVVGALPGGRGTASSFVPPGRPEKRTVSVRSCSSCRLENRLRLQGEAVAISPLLSIPPVCSTSYQALAHTHYCTRMKFHISEGRGVAASSPLPFSRSSTGSQRDPAASCPASTPPPRQLVMSSSGPLSPPRGGSPR